MKLVVDLMGGDNSCQELVKGCIDAIKQHPTLNIHCIVKEGEIEDIVKDYDRIKLIYANEVISANDNLLTVTRRKETSMVKAMNYVNENSMDGVVSCGSTAAFVASSIFILKRFSDVTRPALVIDLPGINGQETTFLDLGANVELTNDAFKQLAYFATSYVKANRNIESPKLAILNIGEEEKKGTQQLKELYQEFKNDNNINFNGNIEARYLLNSNNDIILCDGYSGNIALKAFEGMGNSIFGLIKDASKTTLRNKLGLLLLKPFFKEVYKKLDYNNYGGAMLLGVKKIAIKAHGSSDAKTLNSAINQFVKIHKSEFIQEMEKRG